MNLSCPERLIYLHHLVPRCEDGHGDGSTDDHELSTDGGEQTDLLGAQTCFDIKQRCPALDVRPLATNILSTLNRAKHLHALFIQSFYPLLLYHCIATRRNGVSTKMPPWKT